MAWLVPTQLRAAESVPATTPLRAPPSGDEQVQQLAAQVQLLRQELATAVRPMTPGSGVSIQLGGLVQADAVLHSQASEDQQSDSGQLLNDTRFLIRRARLRVAAEYRYLAAAFELDGNTVQGPLARILGAEVSVQWPAVGTQLPYLKVRSSGRATSIVRCSLRIRWR